MTVWLVILLIVILVLVDSLRRDSGDARRLTKELRQLSTGRGRRAWLAKFRRAIERP
jgi:hypothetical protein